MERLKWKPLTKKECKRLMGKPLFIMHRKRGWRGFNLYFNGTRSVNRGRIIDYTESEDNWYFRLDLFENNKKYYTLFESDFKKPYFYYIELGDIPEKIEEFD